MARNRFRVGRRDIRRKSFNANGDIDTFDTFVKLGRVPSGLLFRKRLRSKANKKIQYCFESVFRRFPCRPTPNVDCPPLIFRVIFFFCTRFSRIYAFYDGVNDATVYHRARRVMKPSYLSSYYYYYYYAGYMYLTVMYVRRFRFSPPNANGIEITTEIPCDTLIRTSVIKRNTSMETFWNCPCSASVHYNINNRRVTSNRTEIYLQFSIDRRCSSTHLPYCTHRFVHFRFIRFDILCR